MHKPRIIDVATRQLNYLQG